MSSKEQRSGVSAIVLAAGASRRMGTPKQLLRMAGKTILQHTLENVRGSRVDEIIVVLGFAADAVEKEISAPRTAMQCISNEAIATEAISNQTIKIVRNSDYQQGMGSSLRTGIAAVDARSSAALIVLADQPFVRATTLDTLIACHRASSPQIIIPMYRGFRGNPVLLNRTVFAELNDLSGDVGCRAIFGNHTENIRKLAVDDPGVLLDVDSRDDFQRLCQAGAASEPPVAEGVRKGSAQEHTAILESREAVHAGQPELVIIGRDAVVQALAKLGRLLKFTITVVDPLLPLADLPEADHVLHELDFSRLPAGNPRERYVVVASRGQCDEEAVEQALRADAHYVALLANKKRAQEVGRALLAQSIAPEKVAAVRAPAGLQIGAESPEEIALSIMAEIVAVRRQETAKR